MDTVIWILAIYWLIGSLARGALEYRAESQYPSSRTFKIGRAVLWAAIWPIIEAIDAYRAFK